MMLAALAFAAPASASPVTSTKDLTSWEWDLGGVNGTSCHQVTPSSGSCLGEADSGAAIGNKDTFTSITKKSGSTTQTVQTLSAEAYHVAQVASGNNKGAAQTTGTAGQIQDDFLGYYAGDDYGLGVQRNVGSPEHSVDNNGYTDLIVFQLPTNINYETLEVSLSPFDTKENMDVTFFWGTPTTALANKIAANGGGVAGFAGSNSITISDLLSGGFVSSTINGLFAGDTDIETVQLSSPKPIQYLIVAASVSSQATRNTADGGYNGGVDDFKVNAIVGAPTHPRYPKCGVVGYTGHITPCPEPASLALFGASLLGMGAFVRRRKAVKRAA